MNFDELKLHFIKKFDIPEFDFLENRVILNLEDFIDSFFKKVSFKEDEARRVMFIIFFSDLKKFTQEEFGYEINLKSKITELFPIKDRGYLISKFRRGVSYDLPRLVISTFGMIMMFLIFSLFFFSFYLFVFQFVEILIVLPLAIHIPVAVVCGIVPVMILNRIFPLLFIEDRFYYIKTVEDFIKNLVLINNDFLDKKKYHFFEIFTEYVYNELSEETGLNLEIIKNGSISSLKLRKN